MPARAWSIVLACSGAWAALSLALSLESLDTWRNTAGSLYAALGHAPPLRFGALARALAGRGAGAVQVILLLTCAYGAGSPLVRWLKLRTGPLATAAAATVLGWSAIALLGHGTGLSGLVFPGVLAAEAAALLAAGTAIAASSRPWWNMRRPAPGEVVPAVLSLLVLSSLFLVAQVPDTLEDARVLHFAAPEHYLLMHKIHAEPQHMGWHLSRGFEMVALAPWAFGGVTAAKLTNVAYAITTMLVLHAFTGALKAGGGAGWWACLWYLCVGVVAGDCWQGKNVLATMMFAAAAGWAAAEVVRGRREWWRILAWLLGAALGVKYTAAFFLPALVVPLAHRARWRIARPGVVVSLGLVPVAGWLLESWLFLGNPFHPFLSGVFPEPAWSPFYQEALHDYLVAISPEGTRRASDYLLAVWRLFGDPMTGSPALFALLPLALLRRNGGGWLKIAVVIAYLLWLPTERVASYLAPVIPLTVVLTSVVDFRGTGGKWLRSGRLVLAAAAVSAALLNAACYLSPWGWQCLTGQMSADDLLARKFTTWEMVREWANRNLPAGSRIVFADEPRRLGFVPRVISDGGVGEPVFWRLAAESRTAKEMRKRARQRGLTHCLTNFETAVFRGTHWYAGPPWTERQLAVYAGFVRRYFRAIYTPPLVDRANGGFYVFEIVRRSRGGAREAWFLPGTEGRFRPARLLHMEGKGSAATAEWERAMRGMEGVMHPLELRARLEFAAGRYAECERILKACLGSGMVTGLTHEGYGIVLVNLGRSREAIRFLCRSWLLTGNPEVLPELGAAFYNRGVDLFEAGDFRNALRYAEQAILLSGKTTDTLTLAEAALEKLGRMVEFEEYVRRARTIRGR